MLDRASTFAGPEIVDMLKTRFVPVAIDQAYQRRQQDTEGDFYRQIAGQAPRNDFRSTTQGFYIATASGDLLLYNNNRDPAKLRRLMKQKLSEFESRAGSFSNTAEIRPEKSDPRYNVSPPEGGLVVRVRAKVLGGYEPTTDRWRQIFQTALSRDNLWISPSEHEALVRGELPASLQQRIARFHLVDNTRGEPSMWKLEEIRKLEMNLADGQLNGVVHLETARGDRGYDAELKGVVELKDDAVVRFDMVVLGEAWLHPRCAAGKVSLGYIVHAGRRNRCGRSDPAPRIARLAARLPSLKSFRGRHPVHRLTASRRRRCWPDAPSPSACR